MERYYRVARNCIKAIPVRQEITKGSFECAIWNEANELAWDDMKDIPDHTYEQQQEHCDKYYDALISAAGTVVTEYDEEYIRIEGGIDIGDFTYYVVTDDRIRIQDLPRKN